MPCAFLPCPFSVNNDDSVNLRVLTEAAMTHTNERAKQADVDNIRLEAGQARTRQHAMVECGTRDSVEADSLFPLCACSGDVIRAYATYSANGIACDTAIHTFNAPEMRQQSHFDAQARNMRRISRPIMTAEDQVRTNRTAAASECGCAVLLCLTAVAVWLSDVQFWTQAAIEAELNHAQGACPAIAMDTDILKMAGLRDTYVLSFENKVRHATRAQTARAASITL